MKKTPDVRIVEGSELIKRKTIIDISSGNLRIINGKDRHLMKGEFLLDLLKRNKYIVCIKSNRKYIKSLRRSV
jgi:hypothetical protein